MTLAGAHPSAAVLLMALNNSVSADAGLLWAGPWGDSFMELSPEFSPHLANSCGPT